ncbi:MAG: zinc ribbon domain-containing protein [Candidatus Hodarchaeales archaeon]
MIDKVRWNVFWTDLADSGGTMHEMNFGFFWPMMLGGMVLWVLAVYWVYRDAESMGKDGLLWAILVAVTMMMGLFVYLAVRISDKDLRFPVASNSSGSSVGSNGIYCPNCGAKNLPDAKFCSNCAALL